MSWGSSKKQQQDPFSPGLSQATQALLQDVMVKRGLSARAVQDVQASLQRGDNQWVEHISTAAGSSRPPTSSRPGAVKVPRPSCAPSGTPPLPPGRFSGIKLQHEIARDAPYERPQFRGGPMVNREAEKDKLCRVLEYGAAGAKEIEERAGLAGGGGAGLGGRIGSGGRGGSRHAQQQPADPREALIDQIVAEVKERREFLEEMRAAGRGGAYEASVRADITQRLAELRDLGVQV